MATNLSPNTLMPVEFKRRQLFIIAPHGTTLDDVKHPEWLMHHVKALAVNDLLEIVAEDGTFDVLARVMTLAPGYVGLRILNAWEASATADYLEDAPGATISFTPRTRWRVIATNGETVIRDLPTEADAIIARDKYLADLVSAKAA